MKYVRTFEILSVLEIVKTTWSSLFILELQYFKYFYTLRVGIVPVSRKIHKLIKVKILLVQLYFCIKASLEESPKCYGEHAKGKQIFVQVFYSLLESGALFVW